MCDEITQNILYSIYTDIQILGKHKNKPAKHIQPGFYQLTNSSII